MLPLAGEEASVGDLAVVVRLHGEVVEDRLLAAPRRVRLGEAVNADVPFPGADFTVVRSGNRYDIRGRSLAEGDELDIRLGPVQLHLSHTRRAKVPHEWAGRFDTRFLMVIALASVTAAWIEAFDSWSRAWLPEHIASDGPLARLELAIWPEGDDATSHAAAVPQPDGSPRPGVTILRDTDGPRHRSDDDLTGTGWYRWYRNAVPEDDEQTDAAVARYLRLPADVEARRLLARTAYDADDTHEAARLYRWICDRHPTDPDARLRLARSEMRRGRHGIEIGHYKVLLADDPSSTEARAGLAVALARLERLDEAALQLDELSIRAPDDLHTAMAHAKIAALEGRSEEALEHLDIIYSARRTLSEAWHLELRRDLATDPAFAGLRKGVRLRSLVHRHLGAAGPQPVR